MRFFMVMCFFSLLILGPKNTIIFCLHKLLEKPVGAQPKDNAQKKYVRDSLCFEVEKSIA